MNSFRTIATVALITLALLVPAKATTEYAVADETVSATVVVSVAGGSLG